MANQEVFEYKLSKADPIKGQFIRALTHGGDDADSIKIDIDKLRVEFYNKNIKTHPLGSVQPDPDYGQLYYANSPVGQEGLYYLPPAPATSNDFKLIFSETEKFIRSFQVTDYAAMLALQEINKGDRALIKGDPISDNNGEWIALFDISTTTAASPSDWQQLTKPITIVTEIGPIDETTAPTAAPSTGDFYIAVGTNSVNNYPLFDPPTGGLKNVKNGDKIVYDGSKWVVKVEIKNLFELDDTPARSADIDKPYIDYVGKALIASSDGTRLVFEELEGGNLLGTATDTTFDPEDPANIPPGGYNKGDHWKAGTDGDYMNFNPPGGLLGVKTGDELTWTGSTWVIGSGSAGDFATLSVSGPATFTGGTLTSPSANFVGQSTPPVDPASGNSGIYFDTTDGFKYWDMSTNTWKGFGDIDIDGGTYGTP